MSTPDGAPYGSVSPATNVQVVAAGPANYERSLVEQSGRIGVRLGHQLRASRRHDLRDMVHLRPDRQGVVADHDGAADRDRHLYGHAVQGDRSALRLGAVRPDAGAGHACRHGTLTFTDPNTGTFAYTVNGITQTKPITRQVFDQLPTCTFGIQSDLTLAYNYQDLWWAAPGGFGVGMGRQSHAPGRHDICNVVYLRPRSDTAMAFSHGAEDRRGYL